VSTERQGEREGEAGRQGDRKTGRRGQTGREEAQRLVHGTAMHQHPQRAASAGEVIKTWREAVHTTKQMQRRVDHTMRKSNFYYTHEPALLANGLLLERYPDADIPETHAPAAPHPRTRAATATGKLSSSAATRVLSSPGGSGQGGAGASGGGRASGGMASALDERMDQVFLTHLECTPSGSSASPCDTPSLVSAPLSLVSIGVHHSCRACCLRALVVLVTG